MAIPRHEFWETKQHFFDLDALQTDRDGWITAVAVTVQGIRGGDNARAEETLPYRLLIDLTQLRRELPTVWVVSPPDNEIEHMNVFRPSLPCPFTGGSLPTLCWGKTPAAWRDESINARTLANLLEPVRQVLANRNPRSRARG